MGSGQLSMYVCMYVFFMMPRGPMTTTETKGERKRTTTTKQSTSNSLHLAEEVTPQILSSGTKPFVILTDALFNVDACFQKVF